MWRRGLSRNTALLTRYTWVELEEEEELLLLALASNEEFEAYSLDNE